MKKAMKRIKQLVSFAYQLPQDLIGLALVKITKASKSSILCAGKWHIFYIANKHTGSWSFVFGDYVVFGSIPENSANYEAIAMQDISLLLGWLYLPVALGMRLYKAVHK